MNEEHSARVMNSWTSVAQHFTYCADVILGQMQSPFVLLKPRLFPDGNQWCALYGDNIQEGLCGFGDTPAKAVLDFDTNYWQQSAINKGE